jgi:hypothetical protein
MIAAAGGSYWSLVGEFPLSIQSSDEGKRAAWQVFCFQGCMWDRLDRGKDNYKFPHDFSFEKTWAMVTGTFKILQILYPCCYSY